MSIQWYPGHMVAAKREIIKTLAHTDVVIELVDARCPQASLNPMLDDMRLARQRPCLRLLNKADVADQLITQRWCESWRQAMANGGVAPVQVAPLNAKRPDAAKRVLAWCRKLAPHRQGAIKPLRLLLVGAPNVGKSTLLNALAKRRLAAAADQPALTQRVSRYDVAADLTLFDSPGLTWPKFIDAEAGMLLAICHTLGVSAYHAVDAADYLARCLARQYQPLLQQRYGWQGEVVPEVSESAAHVEAEIAQSVVKAVAVRYGLTRLTADLARERAALQLLNDFRCGTLGPISLEVPGSNRLPVLASANVETGD